MAKKNNKKGTETKINVYDMVTNRIIEQLEQGYIPWQKPWSGVLDGAFNRISKHPYSLLNQMLLPQDGEYASYKQWTELGGQVKKGEKAHQVVFWKLFENVETDEDGEEIKRKMIPYLRYLNVFHISQVEGVESLPKEERKVEGIEEIDRVIKNYAVREDLTIQEKAGDEACYSPTFDWLTVPLKNQFRDSASFYATLFHETVHSTGHKKRLDRFDSAAKFGNEAYSKEELIAEIGSATLMNLFGIETEKTIKNTSAYCQSWLSVLKNDNKFIVSAASKAEKAVNLILH